jgi:tRNA A-37 threonylcarbamoyl transferase component Bud32
MCGKQFTDAVYCPTDGVRLVPDHDGAERIGKTVGDRYRIVRKIGQGGSGEVFEAEHVYIHKRVALKLLRSQLASRAEAIQRLHREARATSAIGHPNIVEIEDFGTTEDGLVFLAMEWLDGEPLDRTVARGAMPVERALAIAQQVCAGLAAAHEAGVIHRDLKPENIFIARTAAGEQAKILDFGVAKLTTEDARLTATGMVVGTPYYMAPEQAAGRDVDGRSDVYALGVILYEMVTGTLPFTEGTALSVIRAHLEQPPEPPRKRAPALAIPAEVEALILRCMAKKPASRYASARALADALHALAGAPGQERAALAFAPTAPASATPDAASGPAHDQRPDDAARTALVGERAGQKRGRLALVGVVLGLACGALTFALVRSARQGDDTVVLAPDGGAAAGTDTRGIAGIGAGVHGATDAGSRPDDVRRPPVDATEALPDAAPETRPDASPETRPDAASDTTPDAAPRPADDAPDASPGAARAPRAGAGSPAAGGAPARAGTWRYTAKTDDFDYQVIVPAELRPGAPFTLQIEITQAIDDILVPLHAGKLRAELAYLHFKNHRRTRGTMVRVSSEGVLRTSTTLPASGKYHVELTLLGRGRFRTRFDICVGADPRGKLAARVCPRLNRR